MAISKGFIKIQKDFYFNVLRSGLTSNQKIILMFIKGKVEEWPETRESQSKEMSLSYISTGTGIHLTNVSKYLKKLQKYGYIEITKTKDHSRGSIIKLLNSTPLAIASITTPTIASITNSPLQVLQVNQESISKNLIQENSDSDSSINIQEKESNKKITEVTSPVTSVTKVIQKASGCSSIESNSNKSAEILPGAGAGEVSKKALTEGQKVLTGKGLDCDIVVSRILADMTKHNIRCRDRYFLKACHNERAVIPQTLQQSQVTSQAHPAHSETKNVIRQASTIDKVRCWEKENIQEVNYMAFTEQVKTQFPEVFNTLWAEVESSFKGQKFVFDIQKYQKFYEMYMACV